MRGCTCAICAQYWGGASENVRAQVSHIFRQNLSFSLRPSCTGKKCLKLRGISDWFALCFCVSGLHCSHSDGGRRPHCCMTKMGDGRRCACNSFGRSSPGSAVALLGAASCGALTGLLSKSVQSPPCEKLLTQKKSRGIVLGAITPVLCNQLRKRTL